MTPAKETPRIVMVHGLFGHLRFEALKTAFDDYEINSPDLIGYGVHKKEDTSNLTLQDQADHVIQTIEQLSNEPVHIVGHSVGGAVAVLVAFKRPELLVSLTSVEGNFTIADAFWSQEISKKSDDEVEETINDYRRDPFSWIAGAIAKPSPLAERLAVDWLYNQPASTIKAQARAVVAATNDKFYLESVRSIIEIGLPVHLVAGQRSSSDWAVPEWINSRCTTRLNLPDTGHLMMVEKPKMFANALQIGFELSKSK